MRRPPVIILGMHRSGTSMITRALQDLGLFLGHKRDENDEALFFMHLNEWLLSQAGASWDNPAAFDAALTNDAVCTLAARSIERFLGSARLVDYLGIRWMIRYRKLHRLDRPWGFKDPRASLTLPIWLRVFPDARVVHILRNGVDVASSLVVRRKKQLAETEAWLDEEGDAKRGPRWNLRRLADTVRLATLEEAFTLWEAYVERAERHMAKVPDNRTLTLTYEDFVTAPKPWIEKLTALTNLPADEQAIAKICADMRPGRVNAWKDDEALRAFHDSVRNHPLMRMR